MHVLAAQWIPVRSRALIVIHESYQGPLANCSSVAPRAEVIGVLVYFQWQAARAGKDGWSLAGTVHLMLGSCGGDLRPWPLSDQVGGWAAGGGWDTPEFAHLTPPPGETSAEMSPQIAVKINSRSIRLAQRLFRRLHAC